MARGAAELYFQSPQIDVPASGTTTPAAIVETSGSGVAGASVSYAAAGVYTIGVTITDDDGGGGSRSSVLDLPAYLVVYDPAAGFVTGGGWIWSPAGAYADDPTLSGRATFGLVSRYERGATAPSGTTEFHFRAGGFEFKSTSYDWLVVSGSRAKYKGVGTVNGQAGYGFLLSAVDGAVSGGPDEFRIKIWDIGTDVVVYDNRRGADDDSDAATALGGGGIVIHRK